MADGKCPFCDRFLPASFHFSTPIFLPTSLRFVVGVIGRKIGVETSNTGRPTRSFLIFLPPFSCQLFDGRWQENGGKNISGTPFAGAPAFVGPEKIFGILAAEGLTVTTRQYTVVIDRGGVPS